MNKKGFLPKSLNLEATNWLYIRVHWCKLQNILRNKLNSIIYKDKGERKAVDINTLWMHILLQSKAKYPVS